MQITPDQLFEEAAAMALELRLKDRVISGLEAERNKLAKQVAELTGSDGETAGEAPGAQGHSHSHT